MDKDRLDRQSKMFCSLRSTTNRCLFWVRILANNEQETYPQCIAGERACPPEDCGGPPGYEHLLDVLRNPNDPQYSELLKWAGNDFDPANFDAHGRRWLPIMLTYS